MTHPSKIKGNSFEREIVQKLRDSNIEARRVPLSGAAVDFKGDLMIPILGLEYQSECKRRKRAFFSLDRWLGTNRFLFIRDDRSRPMVVMDMDMFIALLEGQRYGTNSRLNMDRRHDRDAEAACPSTLDALAERELARRELSKYTPVHYDQQKHGSGVKTSSGPAVGNADSEEDFIPWPPDGPPERG